MDDMLESPICVSDSHGAAGSDIVEIPLLLSQRQMAALEKAAHANGLSAAAMVRKVLARFLDSQGQSSRTLRDR